VKICFKFQSLCKISNTSTSERDQFFNANSYVQHMGTAIKHPVSDRGKPSFVIFDIRALWRSRQSGCPGIKNYKWRLNPVWHRMLYSCTSMATATVDVKGLKQSNILK